MTIGLTTVYPEEYELIDELLYCLDSRFPAPVIEAMLALAEDEDDALLPAYVAWARWGGGDRDEFIEAVQEVSGSKCVFCDHCGKVTWHDDATRIGEDRFVHDRRCLDNYCQCSDCGDYFLERDTTYVDGRTYCDDSCLGENCTWCDSCDTYYRDDNPHQHDDDDDDQCSCEADHRHFEFPNDGHGTVSQNVRVSVELPAGTIDEEGMRDIAQLVSNAIPVPWLAQGIVQEVGPMWQSKRGNFTRRLSALLYSKHQFKLSPSVISEVGNLARAHSSDTASWLIEFTRDLNDSAEAFCNEDSCWWQSYGYSRCALKSWGGLGMRSYSDDDSYRESPDGRAWVQPLTAKMTPTHDTIGAHAYVVYNGYGNLNGYVAARIIGHLTGRTYRKIGFEADPQYVNGSSGYLVADKATCKVNASVSYAYASHQKVTA